MNDLYRFAGGETQSPQLFIAPLLDRGVGTLIHEGDRYGVNARQLFLDFIGPELTDSDDVTLVGAPGVHMPSTEALCDRFEDITGLYPGRPTIRAHQIPAGEKPEETLSLPPGEVTAVRLERFYRLTGLRPHVVTSASARSEELSTKTPVWGADTNKLLARVRLPETGAPANDYLHELGHCAMPWVAFTQHVETGIDLNTGAHAFSVNYETAVFGLQYVGADGELKGSIVEEATSEGLGSLVNGKLGLVPTMRDEAPGKLPEIVAPYMVDKRHAGAAPAAVALELIAQELGIPSDRYFGMWANYANAGVRNPAARQEMAETIHRGTRGKLTLGQVEELPYPINKTASLALLWAVEDSLDVPDHRRYADLFFQ